MLELLFIASVALATTDQDIDKAAMKVKVFRQSDPPESCKEMGEISTPNIKVIDDATREKMLRRLASQKGANGMQVISIKVDNLTAAIFKCN